MLKARRLYGIGFELQSDGINLPTHIGQTHTFHREYVRLPHSDRACRTDSGRCAAERPGHKRCKTRPRPVVVSLQPYVSASGVTSPATFS
jgi:hypothetical protein